MHGITSHSSFLVSKKSYLPQLCRTPREWGWDWAGGLFLALTYSERLAMRASDIKLPTRVNQMLYTWVCLVLQWINESLRDSVRQALAKGGGERSWKGNPSPCGSPWVQQDFGRKRCWSIGSKGHLESKILVHIRRNFHLLSPPLSNGSSKGPRSLFYCFRCPCTINSAWHLASEHL